MRPQAITAAPLNFDAPAKMQLQNGCHPEHGESRARDLTSADCVVTTVRIARTAYNSTRSSRPYKDLRVS